MGRPKSENSIRHFSHPHPLFESSLNPQEQSSSCCVVCKLKLFNIPSYTCKPCNFHIHQKCSELPQKLRQPYDKNHLLSLIPSPKYQEGRFRCDACGKNGDGFAYHCGDCGIDLHTVCANMPSRVTHQSHPHHQLSLTFSLSSSRSTAPSSFHCSVCRNLGSNSWLYSCRECGGFNAHLLCARRKLTGPEPGPSMMQPQFNSPTPYVNELNVPSPVFNNPYPDYSMPTNMNPMIRPLIDEMLNNLVTHAAQDPSQVSQLLQMLGPLGTSGGGSGLASSSGYPGYDPSVYSSVDPSMYAGVDPSLGGGGSGLASSSGYDPSVYSSVDPSMFAGFDPSLGGGGFGLASSSGYPGFDPSVFSSLGGGGFGLASSSGYPGFDPSVFSSLGGGGFGLASGFVPSVFSSVDLSVFTGFDPSLLSTLFSGLSFF